MNLDWLPSVMAMAAAMLALRILPVLMRNRRRRADSPATTRIAPEPWTMAFCAVFFAAMSILSLLLPFFDDSVPKLLWWAFSPAWGALCLVSASALSRGASVEWSDQSIMGPAREWNFTLRIPRNEIEWLEVRACGTTRFRSWFLESQDGRRVYWGFTHRGWGLLRDEIAKRRPDLRLPIEMR